MRRRLPANRSSAAVGVPGRLTVRLQSVGRQAGVHETGLQAADEDRRRQTRARRGQTRQARTEAAEAAAGEGRRQIGRPRTESTGCSEDARLRREI